MKPTKANDQILGDMIAQNIKVELDEQKLSNLIENAPGSHISFLNSGALVE